MRVTYIANHVVMGDGVGNSIIELVRFLAARREDVRILHEGVAQAPEDIQPLCTRLSYKHLRDRRGPASIRPALAHWEASDVVFYDYSIYYPLVESIRLPSSAAKVFVYHGVTPPHLWPIREGLAQVQRGVDQLVLARSADLSVTASAFTRDELVTIGVDAERIVVIPYAVRQERFQLEAGDETLRQLWGLQGHFVLLYTGRMARNKRIDVLVRGLAAARRSGLPIKLLLVGEDKARCCQGEVRAAQALAASLGVKNEVVFTGKVAEEVLPRYFQLADLYVTASVHEGFGIPVVEAMACGKPVVAARASATPSVVGDAGRLFEPDDADGMAGAVVELLQTVVAPPAAPLTPPRLCFVVPRYGRELAFGAETLCRRWAETCRQAGWTVRVVSTTTNDMVDWKNHFPAGEDEVNGVPVTRFPVDSRTHREHLELHQRVNLDPVSVSLADQRRWMETGIGRPALFRWLAEHRQDYDYFVFLPVLFNTTVLGVEAVSDRALVIPCLHDEGPAYTAVVREALERARGLFFHAPAERDFALRTLRLANPRCFTLGMGMDTTQRGDAASFRKKFGVDGELLLYCGRLEDGENVPLLLDSFRRFQAQYPGKLRLVLIGSGTVPSQEGVLPLGVLPEQDRLNALAATLALVNPSLNESSSPVLLESWLQGRPVLVHRECAVAHEHVQRCKGGFAFADAEELAGCIQALLHDRALGNAQGARGRRFVQEHYAWPRLLTRFRQQLDLLRTTSDYEDLALRAIARARTFDLDHYCDRWQAFLERLEQQTRPYRQSA